VAQAASRDADAMLDQNHDESIMDDVTPMIGRFVK